MMVNKTGSARARRKRLGLDEALIALSIGAMNANDHVAREEARAIPAKLRPSAFAIVADLLPADGTIDARERTFLQRLAIDFNIRARVASQVIEAMLAKNRL